MHHGQDRLRLLLRVEGGPGRGAYRQDDWRQAVSDKERQRRYRAERRRREGLRKEWERQRQHIADTYFYGDVQRADDVMEALPFSAIPTWEDVENAIQAVTRSPSLSSCWRGSLR